MKRRSFLNFVATVASVAVADPEQLIWVPDKKKIFIPAPAKRVIPPLVVGVATNAIKAGNYGTIQIYGRQMGDLVGPGIGVRRYVQAKKDLWPGDIVTHDQVDYGNAPLWYTGGQNGGDVFRDMNYVFGENNPATRRAD